MLGAMARLIVKEWSPIHERWRNRWYILGGALRKAYLEARLAKCGKGLIVNGKPIIYDCDKISIGDHVTINNGVQICPRGNVVIDDYVTLSRGSQITAGELDTSQFLNEGYKRHEHIAADVHIGEGCWLCVNSIVLPGVNISGKGVIVAAGAVVAKDVTEDYVIVGGVPARIVKRLKDG